MNSTKQWQCPNCHAYLRERGVRVVLVNASYWDEYFGTGETAWYVDGWDHGDGNGIDIECLGCNAALLSDMSDDIYEDILANQQ